MGLNQKARQNAETFTRHMRAQYEQGGVLVLPVDSKAFKDEVTDLLVNFAQKQTHGETPQKPS